MTVYDIERRSLIELQRAAIERANGEITQDEMDGYAIRYAAAVRERREQHMDELAKGAIAFSEKLYGA